MSVVCVIDDEPLVRKSLANLLRSEGYDVVCFPSGVTFLASNLRSRADCLVVDVGMPELSGPETCRQLAMEGYHLPVIYLSARPSVPEVDAMLQGTSVQFFAKPFEAERLLTAIDEALEGRS